MRFHKTIRQTKREMVTEEFTFSLFRVCKFQSLAAVMFEKDELAFNGLHPIHPFLAEAM